METTNVLDESGPPWENQSTLRQAMPHANAILPRCSTRNAANPGVAGMSSGTGGSTHSNKLGNTQPASARDATDSLTMFKLAVSPPPLSPCNMMPATCGCLFRTVGKQSAQLANEQLLDRTALRHPNPPLLWGNDIVAFSANDSTGTSKIRLRHTKTS